jgi:RNA polymerase sigma factor (sigma-70 family)
VEHENGVTNATLASIRPVYLRGMQDLSDKDLLSRVAPGGKIGKTDETAARELCRRYDAKLFRFVRVRLWCSEADAQDIVQTTWLKVMSTRRKYDGRNNAAFPTWLFTIAINCCNDWRARQARIERASVVADEQLLKSASPLPDSRAEVRDSIENNFASIRRLSEKQRTAYTLQLISELKYREIAEAMGISLDAVKVLIWRARQNLAKWRAKGQDYDESPG